MCFSENVKKLRLQKGITQEELASALGVCPQAVCKWENGNTYPDGPLLLPLSKQLGVSLDTLFANEEVYTADVAEKITRLLSKADEQDGFSLARTLCWQMQKGLFYHRMPIDLTFLENELTTLKYDSYILTEGGFTLVCNQESPFFSVFPRSEDGYSGILKNAEEYPRIFKALSSKDTLRALFYLMTKEYGYLLEDALLMKECGIDEERIDGVIDDLCILGMGHSQNLRINDEPHRLFLSTPSCTVIALLLMAKQIGYKGAHCLTTRATDVPFLKERSEPTT